MKHLLQQPGKFGTGCNYWASHAGTAMWRDWREDVVRADFEALAQAGIRLLRIFPLWPDFQPLVGLRGYQGELVEYRLGPDEQPLGGRRHASVDPTMLSRLARVAELAAEHELSLIVGLVTGWMSGRLFVPAALEGLNPVTDPAALVWQTKLVQGIVDAGRQHSAILAWDLGNECNCLGRAANPEEAYHWTASIAHAIRALDPKRPIVSGMHSLSVQPRAAWRIADQGELTDYLTTHPYPYWVEHGRTDPLDSYRTTLLPSIETCLYRDVGGKPCFAEEMGSMGPMVAADALAAGWLRANLFSLWAHDARALLWWCAFDQTHLTQAPYDWIGVETELGLFDAQRRAKPTALALKAFAAWLHGFEHESLPPRTLDAVCILSRQQDSWAAAIGTFALAKQCGVEIAFRFADQDLPPAGCLLLPCLSGPAPLRRREWHRILQRVQAGATLYLSLNDGVVPEFTEHTGLRVLRRSARAQPASLRFTNAPEQAIPMTTGDRLECEAVDGTVHATDETGAPALVETPHGKGRIISLTFPLERQLALTPGALDPDNTPAARRIYQMLRPNPRALACDNPAIGVTEHRLSDTRALIVAVNYTPKPTSTVVRIATGYRVTRTWRGPETNQGDSINLSGHDALVFMLERV